MGDYICRVTALLFTGKPFRFIDYLRCGRLQSYYYVDLSALYGLPTSARKALYKEKCLIFLFRRRLRPSRSARPVILPQKPHEFMPDDDTDADD